MTGRISVNGIELRQPGDEEPIAVGRANLWAETHGLHDWGGEVVIRHGATFVPVVNGPHEVKLPDGTSHGVLVTNVNTFSRTWGVETTVTLRGSGGPVPDILN